jgi:hypothetical protein
MPVTNAIARYWILNLAIEFPRKLSNFVPFVEEEHLNVRKIPGVAPTDYAAMFLELFDSGSIRLRSPSNDEEGEIAVSRSELESVLGARLLLPSVTSKIVMGPGRVRHSPINTDGSPDFGWELTQAGGEEWEALAQPNWERFINFCTDARSGDAWSSNLDSLMTELGWCRELHCVEIDRKTLSLEVLHDYSITYWKVLPVVYHATFRSKWAEYWWLGKGTVVPKWFRDWWLSRSHWYKEPWALPSWPAE